MREQIEKVIKIGTISPEEILAELQNKNAVSKQEKTDVQEEPSASPKPKNDQTSANDDKSIYELLEEDIMLVGSTGSGKSSTVNAKLPHDLAIT